MKKRMLSLLLVFCMLFSLVPTAAFAVTDDGNTVELTNPFKDVKETDWCYDAVQYARMNGFFNGTTKTTFDPNGTMTRGMFVTVLGRMAGVDTKAYKGQSAFKDVPATKYYAPYVAWAAKYGITTGTDAGTFNPNGLINRQQMAAFFVRYFEAFGVDYETGANITTIPADLANVSSYAKDAVLKLWKQGLLNGDGTNFNPKGNATRAHAATLTMRADEAVEIWYKEPGVPSDRVKIDPATGKPVGSQTPATPVKPSGGSSSGGSGSKPVTPGNQYAVKFYDGSRLIDTLYAKKGEPLGAVPSVEKSSKANAILLGYFTDTAFTQPFYADAPVAGDMNVYAKYEAMDAQETLTITSFAQMDLGTNASFTVVGSGDTSAITLAAMDGSEPLKLKISSTSNVYSITAENGFVPGSSYELTIPEGMNFVGTDGKTLPETVRTASFSIVKDEVAKIQMSEHTHFVQHNNPSALHVGSTVTVAETVNAGDLICFYKTTNPEERNYKESAYMDDPETWFKVASVSGNTVTLAEMKEEDQEKLYDVPDNFPIIGDPAAANGTLTLAADADGYKLDTDAYAMMLTGGENVTADLAYATSKISEGDFVSIYADSDAIDGEEDVYFGKITAYNEGTGEITYVKSSAAEIESAVDLYVKPALEGKDLISEDAREEIEQIVLSQVQESGFAEEAAFVLADLATRTDGFRNMEGVEVLFTDENGNPLSEEEIALLNIGTSFELSDDIKAKVEVITSGDQLHFEDEGSVQLAVGIDGQFEVDVEEGKVCIDLSATFVQEMAIGVTANGSLVKKRIFGFIPVPVGVKVGANVDLLSYTGVRVDVQAYTVAEEDKDLFEQFKDVLNNPEKLADVLPDDFKGLKEGLETVGDVFDKIEELDGMIQQVEEDTETYLGYAEDLENLWAVVDAMDTDGKYNKDDWKELGETFGKTNVSGDLMEMLNLSTETELDADRYAESLEDLLTKYSEMLEKETDWVTLVNEELGRPEINLYGLIIYVQADFLVHADMNIAMGANLQYEVGKRYNMWVKIGKFIKPEAGSSVMDLIDEQFAFQFYVMGKLGLRMGIKGSLGFAIGSVDVAQVCVSFEIGPYVKLYGFFIYEYERMREANTVVWISDQRMAGALYVDFGLYMAAAIEASALELFEVSYEFFDKEIPLLEAGEQRFYYQPDYEPEEGEVVLVKDEDGNSSGGITMQLPNYVLGMDYINLVTGSFGVEYKDYDDYIYTVSSPYFKFDPETGEITVEVPDGVNYMECDLILTYKHGKLAFSTYDMNLTVPLVWTNLSTEELNEFYTVSVRMSNGKGGYDAVWSERVRRGEEVTLPDEAELKKLMGYNDAIHASMSYPDAGKTVKVSSDTSFDCTVSYVPYTITVSGIEGGSSASKIFTTTYGEIFDFSALEKTGTEIAGETYTKFVNVTTDATVTANKQTQVIDLNQPITGKVAEAVRNGITAKANYADDSVTVTYIFSGADVETKTEIIRKGTKPTFDFRAAAEAVGANFKNVSPVPGDAVHSNITYYVECSTEAGKKYTLSFDTDGGSAVGAVEIEGGVMVAQLPTPEKTGYTFNGWYTDSALTSAFTESSLMPKADTTVYAKWTANSYTVTFDVNGGNSWGAGEGTETVTYGAAYGELTDPPAWAGHSFAGWFTAADGGEQIMASDIYQLTEDQTLYAHWNVLKDIDPNAIDFDEAEPADYVKGESHSAVYEIKSDGDYPTDGYTLKYQRQDNTDEFVDVPVDAGTYNVVVTRPADDTYNAFTHTYSAVLTINKATRTVESPSANMKGNGYAYLKLVLASTIDDADEDLQITFSAYSDGALVSESDEGAVADACMIVGLEPGKEYTVKATLTGDRNYEDVTVALGTFSTKAAPATQKSDWTDEEMAWYDQDANLYYISTAEELLYLDALTEMGTTFTGKTVVLDADIDAGSYIWDPIGNDTNSFMGTFDGQGHTISNLYYGYDGSNVGLFGVIGVGAIVKNLAVEDSYFRSKENVGSIVGYVSGLGTANVQNCSVGGGVYVLAENNVGGIVGKMFAWSAVFNCVNYGVVYGDEQVGGIVGYCDADTVVINNANFGSVTAEYGGVGGIVGDMTSFLNGCTFSNNYSAGKVRAPKGGTTYIGALVGAVEKVVADFGGNNFYLEGSAVGKGGAGDTPMQAFGGEGTARDERNGASATKITTPDALLEALNTYVDGFKPSLGTEDPDDGDNGLHGQIKEFALTKWEMGPDGYPLPVGSPVSALRK